MAEFFSKNDGSEVSGGDFIATPGDSNVKYFSDTKNMKITGGRYDTMDRTENQSFGETSSAEFFSKNDGHKVSGGDSIATPGDPNVKYFSDTKNMKITGGRYGTFDRTETQSFGETSSSATHSSTLSQDGSNRYSHPSRLSTETMANQQGAWSSGQFRLDSLTRRSIFFPDALSPYDRLRLRKGSGGELRL
jgi:hypothetical protein